MRARTVWPAPRGDCWDTGYVFMAVA